MPRRRQTIELIEAPDGTDFDTAVSRLGQAIGILAAIAARIQRRELILVSLPVLSAGIVGTILLDDNGETVWQWLERVWGSK